MVSPPPPAPASSHLLPWHLYKCAVNQFIEKSNYEIKKLVFLAKSSLNHLTILSDKCQCSLKGWNKNIQETVPTD